MKLRAICLMTVVLALAACGGSNKSNSYTVGGTISGLTTGSVVLAYNGGTTVTVSAGATTWVFPGAFPAGSSYTVTVQTQPVGELCGVYGDGNEATLAADVTDVGVVCSPFGQWTWVSGGSGENASGAYGTLGAASASNIPGARYGSSAWTDSAGNLWVFGGQGYDASGALGSLNDLWQFSPSTGLWTWMSGASGNNVHGVYGTQGVASSGNVPGSRYSASAWTDASGNLWLFGGFGYGATGSEGKLNDLWKYTPGSGQWTWVSGGTGSDAGGVYGVLGATSSGTTPGARYAASAWIDASGSLWLFGGYGVDSNGHVGELDDLWKFSPVSGDWTWVGGGDAGNASGVYGTQGAPAASNTPGARQASSAWTDAAGNLWLFGGYGYDSNGNVGELNDLWQYNQASGQWMWVSGVQAFGASGLYGAQGTAAVGNVPGARQAASTWSDSAGNLWLFGGYGYDAAGELGTLNDLWQYSSASGQWTWVSGASKFNADGLYGSQGIASVSTVPGARQAASAWTEASSGNLWLFGGVGYGSTGNGYLNDLWQFVRPE
ncbi:MAG TPA: kelch repeat-containing protein [Steroidobacteraceae bacterium]|nr:kelch repeat-containing protein [Steroidobacteraceae bacterium]